MPGPESRESEVITLADVSSGKAKAPQKNCVLRASIRKQFLGRERNFELTINFEASPGFTILFGSSGAGKTTILNCIAGISQPDSGCIAIANSTLYESSRRVNVPVAKRRIGYLFQTLALFPHMSVEQNVHYGVVQLPGPERERRTKKILDAFRIAHLATRSARDISGGEAQRAALARTLVTDPEALLLDEPLAALDRPTKSTIISDLREWNLAHQVPILYATHSHEEVFALGERVIVIESGRIVAEGTPHEVMTAPQLETIAQLAGFENVFDARVEEVHPERGTMICRLSSEDSSDKTQGTGIGPTSYPVLLETPLVRANVGSRLKVGVRAGDILVASAQPVGLSARNVIPGRIQSLKQRDVIVSAMVECGIAFEVHLTLAARESLQLAPGQTVWLVIKTHSCHLMQE